MMFSKEENAELHMQHSIKAARQYTAKCTYINKKCARSTERVN